VEGYKGVGVGHRRGANEGSRHGGGSRGGGGNWHNQVGLPVKGVDMELWIGQRLQNLAEQTAQSV
jgi:hypothetical protein